MANRQAQLMSNLRRAIGLRRQEFRNPTDPHVEVRPSSGITSPPVRGNDPETDRLIEEALARKARLQNRS